MEKLRFPKSARLRKRSEYLELQRCRKKFVGQKIIIDYRLGVVKCPKLGITTPKRFGIAPLRNRFKRLVRDVFRHERCAMPASLEMNVLPRGQLSIIHSEIELDIRGFLRHVKEPVAKLSGSGKIDDEERLACEAGTASCSKKAILTEPRSFVIGSKL